MKLANLGQAAATVSDRAFVSVADGEGRGGGGGVETQSGRPSD